MALFNCKDCMGKVSTSARFWPHCGRVVTSKDRYPKVENLIPTNKATEIYGILKPIIIHNEEGEMGLILPIKIY